MFGFIIMDLIILLIGIVIILVDYYLKNESYLLKKQSNTIQTGGEGFKKEYRIRTVIQNQSTLQFSYLRNVLDIKDKQFTILIKLNFKESPKPNDLIFGLGKETLIDNNTIRKNVDSNYGPVVFIGDNGDLVVKFSNEEQIVWKTSKTLIPNQSYYLMIVINNGRYSLYDSNNLPINGYSLFNLGPDLYLGSYQEKYEDGLVTTIRQVPTHNATLSLFYLSVSCSVLIQYCFKKSVIQSQQFRDQAQSADLKPLNGNDSFI